MKFPLFKNGMPLFSSGGTPMIGESNSGCGCCGGEPICGHTPLEASECSKFFECAHQSWFLVEGVFEDTEKVPWSVLNGVQVLIPPICLAGVRTALFRASAKQFWRRLQGLPDDVIACCEFEEWRAFNLGLQFTCNDNSSEVGVSVTVGNTWSTTDEESDCGMGDVWSYYIALPSSLPVVGTLTIPIERESPCTKGEEEACDCVNMVAVKITQLTGCNGPCDQPCDCPPDAKFALNKIGGCVYQVNNTTEAGCCGDLDELTYYWTDGAVGRDRGGQLFSGSNNDCGVDEEAALGLYVIDDRGCYSYFEQSVSCCSCADSDGEPCGGELGGSLTVELIDPVLCVWRLTASVPGGQNLVCGDSAFIEWRLSNGSCDPDLDCTCEEIEEGECGGSGCSGGLNDGESTEVVITGGSIIWRVREDACGCWGPEHEEPTPCLQCGCCEEPINNIFITVGGISEFWECEGCPDANGTYGLETDDGCTWTLSLFDFIGPCNCNPTLPQLCQRTVQVSLIITCDGENLTVAGTFSCDGVVAFSKTIPIDGTSGDCTLLSGVMGIDETFDGSCSFGAATVSLMVA